MKQLIIILCLALNSACTTRPVLDLSVDSIAVAPEQVCKASVFSLNDTDSKLQQDEYRRFVEVALKKRLFKIAEKPEDADCLVIFNYKMRSEEKIDSTPTYSWIAPKSYSYSGSSYNYNSGNTYQNSGTIQQNGIGHLEQTGSRVYSYTEHHIETIVTAYDAGSVKRWLKDKKIAPKELWQTKIVSSGNSADVRKVFPSHMIVGSYYFGSNTKGLKKVQLFFDSPLVEQFMKDAQDSNYDPLRAPSTQP